MRRLKSVVAIGVWSFATTLLALAAPTAAPTASPTAGGDPDIGLHANVRADSLRYQVVPRRAGAVVSGGRSSLTTNVPSPKPGTTYRNVHAVFDASARLVDPRSSASAAPKPHATR